MAREILANWQQVEPKIITKWSLMETNNLIKWIQVGEQVWTTSQNDQ
jgi:hypothetical protein